MIYKKNLVITVAFLSLVAGILSTSLALTAQTNLLKLYACPKLHLSPSLHFPVKIMLTHLLALEKGHYCLAVGQTCLHQIYF